MSYKKIFKSQGFRFAILKALSFLPDSVMLPLQYWIKMGRMPDFKNPTRFTEKIQLYKMKYRNEVLFTCVDKYHVREYVESKGLGHTLNTLYGVYDDPEQIDFEELPNEFVIKTTDGGGGENVLICRNKADLNFAETVSLLKTWKDKKSVDAGREWAYTGMAKSQYIVEEYLDASDIEGGLIDYKFFCFNGKVYCVQIDTSRYSGHKQTVVDVDFNNLHIKFSYDEDSKMPAKPKNWDAMIEIAKSLSTDFPFVRVDLYNIKDAIIFGELTFYPTSGYSIFTPDSFDFTLGEQFDISSFHKTK